MATRTENTTGQIRDRKNFPVQELHLIDKMWREYSRDRFGLTVQKQIWQSIPLIIISHL